MSERRYLSDFMRVPHWHRFATIASECNRVWVFPMSQATITHHFKLSPHLDGLVTFNLMVTWP